MKKSTKSVFSTHATTMVPVHFYSHIQFFDVQ